MNGRSSTFGGMLAYGLLLAGAFVALVWVCEEYVGPIIRYLMPGVEL
jgi:hypothetical protein